MPSAYLMIIIDETLHEKGSDTTRKEGQGKRTDGTKSGGGKERMEKEETRTQRQ